MSKPKVTITKQMTPGVDKWIADELTKEWDLQWYQDIKAISKEKLYEMTKGAEGILVNPGVDVVDKELLDNIGPQLKVVSTISVGYDHVDIAELKKRNIRLGHTPNATTNSTADLNLGLTLMVTRKLYNGAKCVRDGGWGPWEPNFYVGTSISDKVIGIFGAGRIGQATARRFKGFGPAKIIYNSRSRKPEFEAETGAEYVTFDQLIESSDILSINCDLNSATKHIFNASTFSKMKNHCIIVNTSRGGVIKQDDLIEALRSGQIAGAGLDVTDPEPLPMDSELLKFDNVVVTPHLGSANIETREKMAGIAVRNLIAGLSGDEMVSEVKI